MQIFISWSGDYSRSIAEALATWLPNVVQIVKPIFSQEMEKGTRSIEEINNALEATRFGIICLTPDNLDSRWIHYEAGALAKTKDARIWTVLHGIKHTDVEQPLAQFQHTLTIQSDIKRLIRAVNNSLESPIEPNLINNAVDKWFPELESQLTMIDRQFKNLDKPQKEIRQDRELLNEILEILRYMRHAMPVTVSERLLNLPRLSDRPPIGTDQKQSDEDIPF